MDILYATDENYVRHAAASMVSLMESNTAADEIVIHIMDMNISESGLRALREITDRYGRKLVVHPMGDIYKWFDFSVNAGGFGAGALARLFVARVLDESIHRILYLDCDTAVVGDVRPLFDLNMDGYCLGMVAEPTANKKRRAALGLKDYQTYYNSGVLLINMIAWRELNAERRLLRFLADHGGKLTAPDQDMINGALNNEILQLPPKYNYGAIQIYYSWKAQKAISAPTPFFTEEEYKAGTDHPVIVHFLGEERPWRAGNRHPYKNEYERCLAKTAWKDYAPEEGWRSYFRCFYLFNALTKYLPMLRWKVIDSLIPLFLKSREKKASQQ